MHDHGGRAGEEAKLLTGINPLLTGELLRHLDEMGHSDLVLIVDANFPAHRLGVPCVEVPGIDVVTMTAAVCEVLPLDSALPPLLMNSGDPDLPAVQHELLAAAGTTDINLVDRWQYYDLGAKAQLVISTGELRLWANVGLYKGIPYSQ